MQIGRLFSAVLNETAITTAIDLWEIGLPTDTIGYLVAIVIGQQTEAGDAEAEMLKIKIWEMTGAYTGGSGGATPTAVPWVASSGAAGATVEAVNTTQVTGGTATQRWTDTFHVQAGYQLWFPEGLWMPFAAGSGIVIEMDKVPVDSITFNSTIVWAEAG